MHEKKDQQETEVLREELVQLRQQFRKFKELLVPGLMQ